MSEHVSVRVQDAHKTPRSYRSKTACRNWSETGTCVYGRRCRFTHLLALSVETVPPSALPVVTVPSPSALPVVTVPAPSALPVVTVPTSSATHSAVYVPTVLIKDQAGSDAQLAVRQLEWTYLLKRFPRSKLTVRDDSVGGGDTCAMAFRSTDPDWVRSLPMRKHARVCVQPFDVRDIDIELTLPPHYPVAPLHAYVRGPAALPARLLDVCHEHIHSWITTDHQRAKSSNTYTGVVRYFLRWLDRQLKDMFVEGLAESTGLSIVLNTPKMVEYARNAEKPLPLVDANESSKVITDKLKHMTTHDAEMLPPSSSATADESSANAHLLAALPTGADATTLRCTSWTLGENVATVRITKLYSIIACARCTNKSEVVSVPGARATVRACGACRLQHTIHLYGTLAHALSNAIGAFVCVNCTPIDVVLQSCELMCSCMKCMRDSPVKSINYGLLHTGWCSGCHAKITLQIDTIRLMGPKTTVPIKTVHTEKRVRSVADPRIVPGQPLVDMGTCKHYRKSYRWFRFPCCGKLYPCDVCHEEAIKGEHEMKFANRIVCGRCSHEQPYQANRPCAACAGGLTRPKSTYWEGGKGCRDPRRMIDKDTHKGRLMKKAVAAQSAKTKKQKDTAE